MAVSKHIRRTARATNPFFLELFRESKVSAKRERAWRYAVRLVATGDPPLRFPVYDHLYQLNVCAQRMVELLEEFSSKFSMNREPMLYRQSLIQYVRVATRHDVVEFMSGIELTEGWLFESQRRTEEDRLRDPDDVYISVRQRETERVEQGLPPRIRFLHKAPAAKTQTAKNAKIRKPNDSFHSGERTGLARHLSAAERECPRWIRTVTKTNQWNPMSFLRSVRASEGERPMNR